MPNVYEGHLLGEGLTFGIVVSRFNSFVTEKLLAGALDALKRHAVDLDQVDVFWTPGAFEIPGIAKRLAENEKYDAVLCLGAVIRGATPHFDYVASESAKGIAQASVYTDTPVIYGVITTDTIEQALERAGIKAGNKGFEAAIAGIETANLYKIIERTARRRAEHAQKQSKAEQKQQAIGLYQEGKSYTEIAKLLGRAPNTIKNWLRKN